MDLMDYSMYLQAEQDELLAQAIQSERDAEATEQVIADVSLEFEVSLMMEML